MINIKQLILILSSILFPIGKVCASKQDYFEKANDLARHEKDQITLIG
jgi:hypothetical protein